MRLRQNRSYQAGLAKRLRSLLGLATLSRSGLSADLVLLSAVWQHVATRTEEGSREPWRSWTRFGSFSSRAGRDSTTWKTQSAYAACRIASTAVVRRR